MALSSGETAAVWFLIRKIKAYTADGKVSRGKMEAFGDSGCPGWGQETTTKSCIPCKETGEIVPCRQKGLQIKVRSP